jgi:hypothetical protein
MISFLRSRLVRKMALILLTFAIEPRPDNVHLPPVAAVKVIKVPRSPDAIRAPNTSG